MPRAFAAAVLALALTPLAARADAPRADPASYVVEMVVAGLNRPWSVALLPDGRRLITESAGRLRVVSAAGEMRDVALDGLPSIYNGGQGGLMDVVPDPDFAANGWIYLTMSYGERGANGTRLVRATLAGERLEDVRTLFSGTPKSGNSNNGGRLAFLPDGTLVLAIGDGFDRREDAQDPSNHLGKLVRLDRDGGVPADNPFAGRPGAAHEVFSLGHRNVQGAAVDPADGALLVSEHGPRGGDEINRIRPGANYGWPLVTGGLDYTFARVTPFRELTGYEAPLLEWTPSIAPAGLAVYAGALFPGWRGDLLVPALKEKAVRRVRRESGQIVGQELLLAERDERMRDVKVAPDGSIYVLTDGPDAKLLRLVPPAR
ncbi:PQQ-dependent sugar dehydrogenase [Methylopila sp. Yamaguchi]|uniref:PQQ-dependent sugar dehydrogenase n=1 Tax=Methylopila sp. Yamaguchi TaxID=1437817 RepID=UPI000CB6F5BF|nr:PQQ-dependent sugar dehydrogenase [Methylopila sp. Yamaguchi]GBD48653.1 glucose sorbosone dehydrogenase [Methylopila sp. Yamaguchi]